MGILIDLTLESDYDYTGYTRVLYTYTWGAFESFLVDILMFLKEPFE